MVKIDMVSSSEIKHSSSWTARAWLVNVFEKLYYFCKQKIASRPKKKRKKKKRIALIKFPGIKYTGLIAANGPLIKSFT